jgi:hypothetical protein
MSTRESLSPIDGDPCGGSQLGNDSRLKLYGESLIRILFGGHGVILTRGHEAKEILLGSYRPHMGTQTIRLYAEHPP